MGALEMLRSKADFQQIQGQSHSRAHPLLLVRYRRNGLERTRFGISTGRRVGVAVVRNRIRRRLRTILRSFASTITPGWDVLLIARPAAANASQHELELVLIKLLSSAGVLPAPQNKPTGTL